MMVSWSKNGSFNFKNSFSHCGVDGDGQVGNIDVFDANSVEFNLAHSNQVRYAINL